MSCPDCFRGGAATGTPSGTTKQLHGVSTYIASPKSQQEGASGAENSGSTIILYTDAFGFLLPNNFLLADALAAKSGFTVLVPDIIPGGGMSPAILPIMDTYAAPDASMLSKAWAIGRAMTYFIPFLMRAGPQKEVCNAACVEYASAVKKELPAGAKLGISGYCWGGYQALYVARATESVVDAVFIAHPAKYEATHAAEAVGKGVKVSFAHASEDMALPMAKIEETKKELDGNEAFDLRVYEGCVHGFAVRAIPGKEIEAKAADEALEQAVKWYKKWL
ncbi:hypothetical protein E8E13_011492 [Curvularia kusanoi]|uniref:Dienelactone hydrolase domain-containing protein n=1 Tax=Curvularia kusanoi TaxID=90978 RepID=A0A9P4TN79_CURKU|nr:hypothetical protein E8E13_011492 [Curvularia kusanoi]